MSVLVDENTRILVHGIESRLGRFQCGEMLRYRKTLAGIVSPDGTAGYSDLPPSIPVFASAPEAVVQTGATLSMVFEDPLAVKASAIAAIDSGVGTIICFSEHVPAWDVIDIRQRARRAGARFIGPASSGLLSPGLVKAGYFVDDICLKGDVGVITKSGSVAYAVLAELKSHGIGISAVVATGGDRVKGSTFGDLLPLFFADPSTKVVITLGEIGGSEEEDAAEMLQSHPGKPVIAFVSGRSLPIGQSLGHAGAIAQKGKGDYESKVNSLRSAGVHIADNIGEIPLILKPLQRQGA